MPVLRQKERIRQQFSGGPTGVNVSVQGADQLAQSTEVMLARQTKAVAETMAGIAVEEGTALAKGYVFELNDMGVPDMPDSSKLKMGRLATQSYDRTIDDRYAHQLTTAVRMQIADAQNANQYDFEAFLADAEGRLNGMRAEVPPEMQGAFQQVSSGLMADAGASIGLRNANMERQQAIEMQQPMLDADNQAVSEAMVSYGEEAARPLLVDGFQRLDETDDTILSPAKKLIAKNDLVRNYGVSLIKSKNDVDNMTPLELSEMAKRLKSGTDPELKEYFTGPDGVFYSKAMEMAGNDFGEYYAIANAKLGAQNEAQRSAGNARLLMGGFGKPSSDQDRADMTGAISQKVGFEVSSMDWIDGGLDPEQRSTILENLKTAGGPDASLMGLLSRMENSGDPEELAAFYPLYLELKNSPNTMGTKVSFEEHIGEKTLMMMQKVEAMSGHGEKGTADFVKAVEMLQNVPDNVDMRAKLTASGRKVRDKEDPYDVIAEAVEDDIFGDMKVNPLPEERAQAERAVELWVKTGHTFEDAIAKTKEGFSTRYVESKYYAQGGRSATAPEKLYPDPPIRSFTEFGEMLGNKIDKMQANAWWTIGAPRRFVYAMMGSELQVGDKEFGNTFDILADEEINDMISNGRFADQLPPKDGETFWRAGKDYILVDDPAKKGTYRVMVKSGGKAGSGSFDLYAGNLDIASEYEETVKAKDMFMNLDATRQKRVIDFLTTDDPENKGTMAANRIIDAMRRGDSPALLELIEDITLEEDVLRELGK